MRICVLAVCMALAACHSEADRMDEFHTVAIKLPDGAVIRAETMINPRDQARGMMFRDSLAPDRGMLFIHDQLAKRPYWMFQVRIPLDLIWMDNAKRVVELAPNAQPCQGKAEECPNYGGNHESRYVLELAGGQAERHAIRVGSTLEF